MRSDADSRKPGSRRFRFSLLSVFVATSLVALLIGMARSSVEDMAGWLLLEFGLLATVLMTVVGQAVGKEWGALVGALLGVGTWCGLAAVVYFVPDSWGEQWPPMKSLRIPMKSLPMQCIAVLATVAVVVVPAAMALRRSGAGSRASRTIKRLLRGKRQRDRTREECRRREDGRQSDQRR